jgi:hypothetical protein
MIGYRQPTWRTRERVSLPKKNAENVVTAGTG